MNTRFIKILCLLVFLISLSVILGWLFDIPFLQGWIPHEIHMTLSTAICFFISSVALYFIMQVALGNNEIAQIVLPASAMIILLIMTTILVTKFCGSADGFVNFYIPMDSDALAENIPEAIPIITALTFLLFGFVNLVVLFGLKDYKIFWIRSLAIIMIIVGFSAVIGYLLHIPILYYKFSSIFLPMAFNTGILFILLGIGLFLTFKNYPRKSFL